jgi:heme oxygenase
MVAGWSNARRTPAIESDLAAMGESMPSPATAPEIAGVGDLLGTAYVLEGSRLGGRVLRQKVPDGLPVSFLSRSEESDPWLTVVAALDRLLYSDSLLGEAKDAARRCFALFLNVAKEAGV